jgi:hypothetical protein
MTLTDEELDAIEARAAAATEGPWRSRRASLDAAAPDEPPACWGIAAGKETWHQNKGNFHPKDARYPVDEVHVVEIGYDRDYYTPEAAIPIEADAEFIAHARTDVPALLAEVRQLRAAHVALASLVWQDNPYRPLAEIASTWGEDVTSEQLDALRGLEPLTLR